MELIEVDEEVAAIRLERVSPRKGRERDVRHEERAEESGGARPDAALVQVHDEHLAGVHHRSQIDASLGASKHAIEQRICE